MVEGWNLVVIACKATKGGNKNRRGKRNERERPISWRGKEGRRVGVRDDRA